MIIKNIFTGAFKGSKKAAELAESKAAEITLTGRWVDAEENLLLRGGEMPLVVMLARKDGSLIVKSLKTGRKFEVKPLKSGGFVEA